jgi:NTP pyrophosphatase (non-canonical NTP hydrolase)
MTIQELESIASRGFKRDDDAQGPGKDEIMTGIEIKMKASEINDEIQSHERWNKESIARKTASIIWFAARLAGMYGINLEEELKKKTQESSTPPEKLVKVPTIGRIKDVKTFYGSKGKFPSLPRFSKPKGS